MLTFSIVIPTYNEERHLPECLEAVVGGSEQPLEIIVADGMSSDKTVEIARQFGAKVVNNSRRHAAGGRNAGIKAARGEVIVFLDADCIPDRDWLKEIHAAFAREKLDGVGTCIEPVQPANIYEEFWGTLSLQIIMSYGKDPYYLKEKDLRSSFITASCAYRRDLLIKLKGFSNFFGNNAEDIDLCWRALDAGAVLKYVPEAKVKAHSPDTLQGIKKKSFRNGVSSTKLQKIHAKKRFSIDVNLYKALLQNVVGIFRNERYAKLFVEEILSHLYGKYYESIKLKVINL